MKNLKIHPPSNFYAEADVKPSLTRASLNDRDIELGMNMGIAIFKKTIAMLILYSLMPASPNA